MAALLLAGCEGNQSPLHAAGPQAERISKLWWLFLAVTLTVAVLVLVALAVALVRSRKTDAADEVPELDPDTLPHTPARELATSDGATERHFQRVVGGSIGLTLVTLLVLLVCSVTTGHAISLFSEQPAFTIRVTGHQWWWQLDYLDADPSKSVTTANELHIPVGVPVRLELASSDVIRSFWVPALHGKRDLIPGWDQTTTIQADVAGIYRGQCAEFCGVEHARMALLVVAEPKEKFEAWLAAQREPAKPPQTEAQRRGQQFFERGPCTMCHMLSGLEVPTSSTSAPNLTHLKSRGYIAAGTLPNTRGNLAGWLVDAQGIKPGSHMPTLGLSPDELNDVLEYLETLR